MSYKPYPKYKPSGVEWIGEIPEGWHHKSVKFTGKPVLGKMLTNSDKGEYSLKPYLRAKNVQWESIDANDINEMWFSEKEMGQYRVQKDDLLISEGGEVGRTAIWHEEIEECYLQNSVHKFTTNSDEVSRFHLYQFGVLGKQGYFESIVDRVSIGHLTCEKLGAIPLISPPKVQQTKIATFLDRKTAQIDKLIKIKRKQIELLKEERTAIINQAVTKGLNPDAKMKESGIEWIGEIPEGWDVVKIAQLSDLITNGYVGPTRDILKKHGVRYIQSLHVRNGRIDFHKPYFVTEEWSQKHSRSILKEDDILITQTGAMTGNVAVVQKDFEGVNCHALIIIRTNRSYVSGTYLGFVLRSFYGQAILESIRTGALHPHLNSTYVKDISIPLPSLSAQEEAVTYLVEQSVGVDKAISKAEQQIQLLKEYRTTLISDAVTGKIDIREEAA